MPDHDITINGKTVTFRHPTNDEQLKILNTFGQNDGTGERVRLGMELIREADGFPTDPEPLQVFPFVTEFLGRLMGGGEGN